VHDGLVADDGHDLTTGVQVTPLRERDHPLGQRPDALGARLGRGDGTVLEERGGQVGEQVPLVGGGAGQTGALAGRGHN